MQIRLLLKEKEVSLVLCRDEYEIDREEWMDENDLLEKFFPAIDVLLRRNDLAIKNIDDFSLIMDIPKGYTTARIARTIMKTLNFARST